MVRKIHESAGFTLLEIIIAISLLMLLTGGIIAGYSSFNDTQKIKQAALTFKSYLRSAQTKAVSGVKPTACTTLDGYIVRVDGSSYTVDAMCDGSIVSDANTSYSVTLTGQVIVSNPNTASFVFRVLTRAVSISQNTTFTFENGSKGYQISVSPSGDINELGFVSL
ncbi:type II secretion system protein [Candidatus Gottesmanbacteria bacterium]|nr:type II secretion system protein [Candidatus Gottesmanbacteria bacterium]